MRNPRAPARRVPPTRFLGWWPDINDLIEPELIQLAWEVRADVFRPSPEDLELGILRLGGWS